MRASLHNAPNARVRVTFEVGGERVSALVNRNSTLLEAAKAAFGSRILVERSASLGKEWITALDGAAAINGAAGVHFSIKGGIPYLETPAGAKFLALDEIILDRDAEVKIWGNERSKADVYEINGKRVLQGSTLSCPDASPVPYEEKVGLGEISLYFGETRRQEAAQPKLFDFKTLLLLAAMETAKKNAEKMIQEMAREKRAPAIMLVLAAGEMAWSSPPPAKEADAHAPTPLAQENAASKTEYGSIPTAGQARAGNTIAENGWRKSATEQAGKPNAGNWTNANRRAGGMNQENGRASRTIEENGSVKAKMNAPAKAGEQEITIASRAALEAQAQPLAQSKRTGARAAETQKIKTQEAALHVQIRQATELQAAAQQPVREREAKNENAQPARQAVYSEEKIGSLAAAPALFLAWAPLIEERAGLKVEALQAKQESPLERHAAPIPQARILKKENRKKIESRERMGMQAGQTRETKMENPAGETAEEKKAARALEEKAARTACCHAIQEKMSGKKALKSVQAKAMAIPGKKPGKTGGKDPEKSKDRELKREAKILWRKIFGKKAA